MVVGLLLSSNQFPHQEQLSTNIIRIQEWEDNIYSICKELTMDDNKLKSMSHLRRKKNQGTCREIIKHGCQLKLFLESRFISWVIKLKKQTETVPYQYLAYQ